jgi:hypothetical protein
MAPLFQFRRPRGTTTAGVANSMAAKEQKLLAVELCGNFSDRAASGPIGFSADPITEYLDWVLSADVFMCAVVIPPQRTLKRRDTRGWPQATVSMNDAEDHRAALERSANSGFELVFGTKAALDIAIQFFGSLGYQESARSVCGNGGQHDPLAASWNSDGLSNAISLATKLSTGVVCISAHDADPMYLLIKQ